jgi:GNAT superfamily N-acetyltransferase
MTCRLECIDTPGVAGPKNPIQIIPEDLSAGDARSLALDVSEFEISRIVGVGDPLFDAGYSTLWQEFGAMNEMESKEVISHRLGWGPAALFGNRWLRYEMLVVRKQGQLLAVRDHTAVVSAGEGTPQVVVHLSHVLVEPSWRRTGVAGWLRAWPIQTARACLEAAGLPLNSSITLVAEMEHAEAPFPNRMIRLQAYEKASFKKVDPSRINYVQPDFRSPEAIDTSGGPRPLPFGLIVRRVGREQQQTISGSEIRGIVESLYEMYGTSFRPSDMAAVWKTLEEYPEPSAQIPLVPPTR